MYILVSLALWKILTKPHFCQFSRNYEKQFFLQCCRDLDTRTKMDWLFIVDFIYFFKVCLKKKMNSKIYFMLFIFPILKSKRTFYIVLLMVYKNSRLKFLRRTNRILFLYKFKIISRFVWNSVSRVFLFHFKSLIRKYYYLTCYSLKAVHI